MSRYQIDIQIPKRKETFVTEDLEDDQARKTRLKSFIDSVDALSLRDYTIDIKPLNTSEVKPVADTWPVKQLECMYEAGRICSLGEDQSIDTCLHCEGRGL